MDGTSRGKDELIHEIGSLLLHDPKLCSRPWKHLALVVQVMPGSTKMNGFAYLKDGEAVPTGPRDFSILARFRELREAMREEGAEPWAACLVRLTASLRPKISFDFEYQHPDRWAITPATVRRMADELRPPQ
ncbi:MAG: hypothetical protein ABR950_10130 [Candidatus Dormibacteria bacterium]